MISMPREDGLQVGIHFEPERGLPDAVIKTEWITGNGDQISQCVPEPVESFSETLMLAFATSRIGPLALPRKAGKRGEGFRHVIPSLLEAVLSPMASIGREQRAVVCQTDRHPFPLPIRLHIEDGFQCGRAISISARCGWD